MVSHNRHDFRMSKNIDELARSAARDFAARAQQAVAKKGHFNVALSGGNTPKALFGLLAEESQLGLQSPIPWQAIRLFWGDERFVPHSDSQSNFHMTREYLLSRVPVPAQNIFAIPTEGLTPDEAASTYERTLREIFGLQKPQVPTFDLVYLGMGPDGHTASLFPGTEVVQHVVAGSVPTGQFVAALWVEKFKMHRISFLPNVINAARAVCMLVAGADKAQVLEKVISGPYEPLLYPCQLIVPRHGQIWFLDDEAASKIAAQRRGNVPDF
jgi:6-phosphogluconolactonase